MSVEVSIIIVSYNSAGVLPACLNSLLSFEPRVASGGIEVLVVDNASHDGSADLVARDFPWVRLIRSARNVGFGAANNLAAAQAAGRYLFLLNPDTELRTPVASELSAFMEDRAHGHIAVVGALVEDETGAPGTVGGNFPTLASLARDLAPSRSAAHRLQFRERRDGYVLLDYVTGACMFIRREAFHRAGGFDPEFFLYFEETELQHRLAKMGYARAVYERSRVMHRCAVRDYRDSMEKIRIFEASRILYYRRTMGDAAAWAAKSLLALYYVSRSMLRLRMSYLRAAAFVLST